jgi:hypothetical protein
LNAKELDGRPTARDEHVSGHSNGHSLLRMTFGDGVILVAGEIDLSNAEGVQE